MIAKNTGGQGVYLFASIVATGLVKTGDAASITGAISKDGAVSAATATANPTEIGGGIYWQPLSQAETNANILAIYWSSSTSGVVIDPVVIFTTGTTLPAVAPGAANGLFVAGTNAATTITGSLATTFTGSLTGSVASVTADVGITQAAADKVWGTTTRTITGGTVATATNLTNLPTIPAGWITAAGITASALNGKGDWLLSSGYTAPPTSAVVAAAVWDLATTGHTTGGTFGAAMGAAGAAGDPWSTTLPGAYGAGTAGNILGNRLDAAVSTRSTYSGGAVASVTADVGITQAAADKVWSTTARTITGGTVATATNLTNLPTIPTNWITASGITASALNGKGDWLLASGYTTPPTAAAIATQVDSTMTTSHGSGSWAVGSTAPAGWLNAAAIASSALNGKGDWLLASSYTAPATSAAIATAVWQDATAGDFTVASSIGKSLYTGNIAPGAAGGHFIAGTNAATTITGSLATTFAGNLSGSVASVAADVGITQAAADKVWGTTARTITGGTITTYTGNTPQTGDAYTRIGVAGAGLTSLGDARLANLDAAISTRLATAGYTAPPTAASVAAAVLTTQMTESYHADGVAPTLTQATFVTMQRLMDFVISGTSIAVRKIDGSTTAYGLTLDSPTAPTSSTRTS